MKIWIDFINSPQVSFFEPLINELSSEGHEFILTCRDSANTVQLLKQRNWRFTIIGDRAEKTLINKGISFPRRIYQLYKFLKGKDIQVAVCQSSFYLPLTAKMLGIRSIYTNDNEHAMGNIPSFLFANEIFIPESLSIDKVIKQGARKNKVTIYPGIKEGVYLWPKGNLINEKRTLIDPLEKQIFVRPEPTTAQYYSGEVNFLDPILVELKNKYKITILVRDKEQLMHYNHPKFTGITVPTLPISFEDVAINCLLFLGAGGSMTREMAMMGIPTISVYQGELLDVDKVLIGKGLMIHETKVTIKDIERFLAKQNASAPNTLLIEQGNSAYKLFKSELLK